MIVGVAAVLGALFMAYAFNRMGRSTPVGGMIGAVAGAAGSLLFMAPLEFCTFGAEQDASDVAFGIFLVGVGMAAVLFPVRWFARSRMVGAQLVAAQPSQGTFKGWLTPWLLLLPTLIILVLFLYYPSFENFRLSTLLARLGAPRTRFVCVDNFTNLLGDPSYIDSVLVTFVIAAGILFFGLALALLIAAMAYQPIKGAHIYRTLLIWPYAISPAVAGVIFFLMFTPIAGIINHFLNALFGINVPWFLDPTAARVTIIVASVWKTMGFNILFYIAGLQNIPGDLQEAASIDGANAVQRFFRVTIPLLSPITFFLIITNMTYAFFEIFGTIDMLTGGGPVNSTTTMIYNIFQTGVRDRNLGLAAAQSIILFVMVIGLTALQFRSAGRRVNYGA